MKKYTDDERAKLKSFGLTDSEIDEYETLGVEFAKALEQAEAISKEAEDLAAEALKTKALEDNAAKIKSRLIDTTLHNKAQADATRKAINSIQPGTSREPIFEKAAAIGLTENEFLMPRSPQSRKAADGRTYKEPELAAIALFGAFAKALITKNQRLIDTIAEMNVEKSGQSWQALNYGGYVVPVEYLPVLIEARDHVGPLRALATTQPVSTRTGKMGLESSIVSVTWGKPGASKGVSRDKGTTVSWSLSECNAVVVAEDALLDWAMVDYGAYLTRSISRAIAKSEWDKFITGSGSDQPTGLANASITQTAAASSTVVFTDINSGFFALATEYRDNAVWIMRDNNLETIHNLKDTYGQPILRDIVTAGQPVPTIKGKRYYINNNIAQTTATTPRNNVYFLDMSYYWIFDNQSIRMSASQEATVTDESGSSRNLWQENLTAFKMWEILDMKLVDKRAAAYLSNMS